MVHAVERGDNPFTFWSPEIGLGQPVMRYYQPGAHAIVTAAYFALGKLVPVPVVFQFFKFLALAFVPLSFFYCARLLDFSIPSQIAAAALAPLVSGDGFGIDYASYVWRGYGLFPQAVATHFLLLTIGFGWLAIRRGNSWIVPGLLLAVTGYCNLLYGYVGAVTLVIAAAIPGLLYIPSRDRFLWEPPRTCFVRVLKIGALAGACALPKLLAWVSAPHLLAASQSAASPHSMMFDSFGAGQVLLNLLSGETLDHKRWPVLTILLCVGIAGNLWRNSVLGRFLLAGFACWLLLYFGRPFWGDLLLAVGIVPAFQLHRLIGPVQIFAVLVAASTVGKAWRTFRCQPVALLLGTILFLAPAIQQWRTYLGENALYMATARAAFARESADIEAALALAKQRGGRVYAGLPATWGPSFNVGEVPVFALLPVRGIPNIGIPYIVLQADSLRVYGFRETEPDDYRSMDVRTVLRPADQIPLPHTELIAAFGRFGVYRPSHLR